MKKRYVIFCLFILICFVGNAYGQTIQDNNNGNTTGLGDLTSDGDGTYKPCYTAPLETILGVKLSIVSSAGQTKASAIFINQYAQVRGCEIFNPESSCYDGKYDGNINTNNEILFSRFYCTDSTDPKINQDPNTYTWKKCSLRDDVYKIQTPTDMRLDKRKAYILPIK